MEHPPHDHVHDRPRDHVHPGRRRPHSHDAADRVDPGLGAAAAVGPVRLRWVGHTLRAEAELVVAPELTVAEAQVLAAEAEQALRAAVPHLAAVTVHSSVRRSGRPSVAAPRAAT